MIEIDYRNEWKKMLMPEIVALLTRVYEYKGGQAVWLKTESGALAQMAETARMHSIGAFNKRAGTGIPDERLRILVKDKTRPRTEGEWQAAGYRDVLNMICNNYDHIPLKTSMILQLHRDLYKFEGPDVGGQYRSAGPDMTGELRNDKMAHTGQICAGELPAAVDKLFTAFTQTIETENAEPLILIFMLVRDFYALRPFDRGNGRMSRLLALLLLCRCGYMVGKYVSIDSLMDNNAGMCATKLWTGTVGADAGVSRYEPFVKYMLGVVAGAYSEFLFRIKPLAEDGIPKSGRVRTLIKETAGMVTKKEILEKCPDISQVTVQRTLAELVGCGAVIKIGGGRYTKYRWKSRETDNDYRRTEE